MSAPETPANPGLGRAGRWLRGWKRWRAPELGLAVTLGAGVLLATAWGAERRVLKDAANVGVQIEQLPVTGVQRAGLEAWVTERNAALEAVQLSVRVAGRDYSVTGHELGAHIEPSFVDRLLTAGREGSLWQQLRWRLARLRSPEQFTPEVLLDPAHVEEVIGRWERATLQVPQEGVVRFLSGRVQRLEPVVGRRIARESMQSALGAALVNAVLGDAEPEPVTAELVEVHPTTRTESLVAAEARARALLHAPIQVVVQRTPEAEAALAPRRGEKPLDDSPVALTARALGPALRSRISTERPGDVEVYLDPEGLERALAPVRGRFEQKAANASLSVDAQGRLSPVPSRIQTRILREQAEAALWAAAETPERLATLQVVAAEQPKITTEAVASLNIHELVSSYTTQFPCCQPRVKNIHRIAEMIDGAIVLAGETFSVNEFIGPRTEQLGFVAAPTIVFGEMDDTIGGGVSQFATTLFNAVYDGGYDIIERQPHTYYFDRYPIGNDATLSIPKPDLIFKNDTRSGMLIKADADRTSVRVRIYGDREGRRVTRSVTQPFDRTEPELEWLADATLDPAKERVEERGAQGFTVEVTRTITRDGGEVTKQTRKVIYRPRVRRVAVHPCKLAPDHPDYSPEPCPEPEAEAPTEAGGE